MALNLSTAFQNALLDLERSAAIFITFEFGTGTYGFWTGSGTRNYNGIDYVNGASIFDVSDIEQNSDGSIAELTLSLSAQPDKGITPDVLVALYDEDWHRRPVTIQLGLMDPDTGVLIDVETLFRGTLDTAPYDEGEGVNEIKARCLSRTNGLNKSGGLYRNAATQKRFDDDDKSLDNIGTLNGATKKDLYWGQN